MLTLNSKFDLSISQDHYSKKEDINWANQIYTATTTDIEGLIQIIQQGFNFCHLFNKETFAIKEKTKENFRSASFIVYDVDNAPCCVEDFVNNLKRKPTIAYTTYSSTEESPRFRLLYCISQPITSEGRYQTIYKGILSEIERDNNFTNKDNCASSVNQQFAGNGSSNCQILISGKVYNIKNQIEDETETEEKPFGNERDRKEAYSQESKYIKDFWRLQYSELIQNYKDIYPYFESTPLEVDEDKPYIILPKNYIEIKRYWILEKMKTDNGRVYKISKSVKIKDGQGRRKKLFINGILHRYMLEDITFEHILQTLVNELYYYVDNSKDTITKKDLFKIACCVMNADLAKYEDLFVKNRDQRNFIVNPAYCAKHKLNKLQGRNLARKMLTYQEIGSLYDCSISDSDNLRILKENGVKCSIATLKRFKEFAGLTKKRVKKTTTIEIIIEEKDKIIKKTETTIEETPKKAIDEVFNDIMEETQQEILSSPLPQRDEREIRQRQLDTLEIEIAFSNGCAPYEVLKDYFNDAQDNIEDERRFNSTINEIIMILCACCGRNEKELKESIFSDAA